MPKTWDELLAACKTLKAKGIDPIALGSKNRWPAQFWFDYLLLRTAGPDYRAKLMSGAASYTDAEVKTAMACGRTSSTPATSSANANANDWTDAADQVARGDAAMTLMGTWITGYWNGNGPEAGRRLRLLRVPGDHGRRAERRGRPGRRPGDRRQRGQPGGREEAPRLAGLRPRGAGQVGTGAGRAVAQRQGRRVDLHAGDAAGARRR